MDGGSGTGTGDARGADGGDARAGNPRAGMPVVTGRGMTALRRKFGGDEMSDSRGITRARLLTRFVGDLSSKKVRRHNIRIRGGAARLRRRTHHAAKGDWRRA